MADCENCQDSGWIWFLQQYCPCRAGRLLKMRDEGWTELGRTTDGHLVMARKIKGSEA